MATKIQLQEKPGPTTASAAFRKLTNQGSSLTKKDGTTSRITEQLLHSAPKSPKKRKASADIHSDFTDKEASFDHAQSNESTVLHKKQKGGIDKKSGISIAKVKNLPPSTPLSKLYGTFVFLKVGDRDPYAIHKGLLTEYSPYFKAAFTRGFVETQSMHLSLHDESPDVFDLVYQWFYTGLLTCPGSANTEDEGKDVKCYVDLAAQVWLFADRYNIPLLANKAVDCIIDRYMEHFEICTNVEHVWENTSAGSRLRRLIIDTYVKIPHAMGVVYDTFANEMVECPEFLVDILKGVTRRLQDQMNPDEGDDFGSNSRSAEFIAFSF
ncbi:uncharacterized protein KY384_006997 [Bacidia gigantensis]|uniref:uncharacterized protein n=1 Tax=Bacidia gigantensis TaxID=2732470 RepID=UPI001D0483BD|nr:uncharacterized protein KY384_006997 [Bacidia gigantensis]KAG8528081.1 hypothetical protein KY384_006997 [Bacidia gigantensis]